MLGEQIKHILRPAASREDLTMSSSSGSYFSWKLGNIFTGRSRGFWAFDICSALMYNGSKEEHA